MATSPTKPNPKKRAPLPKTARIQKRPLLHPPPPSPYTSSQNPKTIYLSARTPFMSAIKRCGKLLQLSEKRLVQSATSTAKNERRRNEDGIAGIAEVAERIKRKEGGEEVVFKASGKAIGKGLEVGCWFQGRGETYRVRLRTGSVGVVDGIEYEDEEGEGGDAGGGNEGAMDVDGDGEKKEEELPEARIRQISVLEVYVGLK